MSEPQYQQTWHWMYSHRYSKHVVCTTDNYRPQFTITGTVRLGRRGNTVGRFNFWLSLSVSDSL